MAYFLEIIPLGKKRGGGGTVSAMFHLWNSKEHLIKSVIEGTETTFNQQLCCRYKAYWSIAKSRHEFQFLCCGIFSMM